VQVVSLAADIEALTERCSRLATEEAAEAASAAEAGAAADAARKRAADTSARLAELQASSYFIIILMVTCH
jgi:hypothetical protein